MHHYGDRVVRSYTQRIQAPPRRVFPLLCPVREAEWLEGWAYEMIHSESGVAEPGCVFRTRWHDFPETVWIVTRHDAEAGIVEFARVTTGLAATRLELRLEADTDEATLVHIRYVHTPITEAGAGFIERHYSPQDFEQSMAWWERSMNHFLATGEMLRKTQAMFSGRRDHGPHGS